MEDEDKMEVDPVGEDHKLAQKEIIVGDQLRKHTQNINQRGTVNSLRRMTIDLLQTYQVCAKTNQSQHLQQIDFYGNRVDFADQIPQISDGQRESLHNQNVAKQPDQQDHQQKAFKRDNEQIFKGALLNDRYQILQYLGAGTFGFVYSGRDLLTMEKVAIKVRKANPSTLARYEADYIKMLNDVPNQQSFVTLKDQFEIEGYFNQEKVQQRCLVFEYMHQDLYRLLIQSKFKGFQVQAVRIIAYQLVRAIGIMNDCGLAHCDLKVIDLGSATQKNNIRYTNIQSRYYRSPEVILNCFPYTAAIDIWSIGCILFEMLTGTALFKGKDEVDQLHKIIKMKGLPPAKLISTSKAQIQQQYFRTSHGSEGWQYLNTEVGMEMDLEKDEKTLTALNIEALLRNNPETMKKFSSDVEMEQFIDLIVQMIEYDASKRIMIKQIFEHPFIGPYIDQIQASMKSNKSLINERLSQLNLLQSIITREGTDSQQLKEAFSKRFTLNTQRSNQQLVRDVDMLPSLTFREPTINPLGNSNMNFSALRGGSLTQRQLGQRNSPQEPEILPQQKIQNKSTFIDKKSQLIQEYNDRRQTLSLSQFGGQQLPQQNPDDQPKVDWDSVNRMRTFSESLNSSISNNQNTNQNKSGISSNQNIQQVSSFLTTLQAPQIRGGIPQNPKLVINTHFNDTVIKSGPHSFSARTNQLNQSVPYPSQAFLGINEDKMHNMSSFHFQHSKEPYKPQVPAHQQVKDQQQIVNNSKLAKLDCHQSNRSSSNSSFNSSKQIRKKHKKLLGNTQTFNRKLTPQSSKGGNLLKAQKSKAQQRGSRNSQPNPEEVEDFDMYGSSNNTFKEVNDDFLILTNSSVDQSQKTPIQNQGPQSKNDNSAKSTRSFDRIPEKEVSNFSNIME